MATERTKRRMKYREGRLRSVKQAEALQRLLDADRPLPLHERTGSALVRRGLAVARQDPKIPWVLTYEPTEAGRTFFADWAERGRSPIS